MHGDSRIYLASVMAFLIAKKTEAPRNREASPGPWIEESNQIQFLTTAKLQPCWPPPAPFEDTSHCCDISKNSPFTCHSSLPRSCLVTQRSFPTESCVTRQKWLRGILQYMQEWIMKQKGNQDFGRNLCISLELFLEAIIKTGFLFLTRPQIFIFKTNSSQIENIFKWCMLLNLRRVDRVLVGRALQKMNVKF